MQSGRGPDWRGVRKVELRSESTGLVVAWWLTSISLVLSDDIQHEQSYAPPPSLPLMVERSKGGIDKEGPD